MNTHIRYLLALKFLPGIGAITSRRLLLALPDPEAIFLEKKSSFLKIEGVTEKLYHALHKNIPWDRVDQELDFIARKKIQVVSIIDREYPALLSSCYDTPFLLFYQGALIPSQSRFISIVGTRSATDYGKTLTAKLVEDLSAYNPVIVSGLAYGIDIAAHKAALNSGLQTYAVVAHGLQMIYPNQHKPFAARIVEQGCIITEFSSQETLSSENFPKRNRIIAGISQATIVVEASEKGGALITARIANSYNREVFAFPGPVSAQHSIGCNRLIKNNEALLIESGSDVANALGWDKKPAPKPAQQALFFETIPENEQRVFRELQSLGKTDIDNLSATLSLSGSQVSSALLALEMRGLVTALPGKIFRAN